MTDTPGNLFQISALEKKNVHEPLKKFLFHSFDKDASS